MNKRILGILAIFLMAFSGFVMALPSKQAVGLNYVTVEQLKNGFSSFQNNYVQPNFDGLGQRISSLESQGFYWQGQFVPYSNSDSVSWIFINLQDMIGSANAQSNSRINALEARIKVLEENQKYCGVIQ